MKIIPLTVVIAIAGALGMAFGWTSAVMLPSPISIIVAVAGGYVIGSVIVFGTKGLWLK